MALAPMPICGSCSGATELSSSCCSECNRICCWTCFGLKNGDSVGSEDAGGGGGGDAPQLILTSIRVCNKCRAATNGKQLVVHPETIPVEPSSAESSIQPEVEVIPKESTSKLCIPEEPTMKPLSSDDNPDEPLSIQKEPAEKSLAVSVAPSDDPPSVPEEPVAQLEQNHELCLLHGNERKLYCLTCNESICENCFLTGGLHMRHQIDFIRAVYLERRANTEHKLAQLDETVKTLDGDFAQCQHNLDTIRQMERSLYADVDALCAEAKLTVARITDERKRTLRTRADLPAKKQKLNDALREMISYFPPAEFLKHQSRVEKQCDELLAESASRSFVPECSEDIGCNLVPPHDVRTFQLANFESTAVWLELMHACDIPWTIYLRNKDSLFVKAIPKPKEIHGLPFELLVEILHQDFLKVIRKTFTVEGASKEMEIVSISQLKTQGFIQKSNLYVKIGLRPLNALIVNRLLKQQLNTLKMKLNQFEDISNPAEDEVNCQFANMHFSVNLFKQKNDDAAQHSPILVDSGNRQWCLRVYPFDRSSKVNNDLKAFIVLRKGMYTKCRYFVELLHNDPNKNVQQVATQVFGSNDTGHGWHNFVERLRLLCDSGFYPNGMLRFRFGVQPIAG